MTQSETSSQEKEVLELGRRLNKGIDVLQEAARILAQTVKLQDKIIDGFYDAVAHGDEDHRKWLKETIEAYRNSYAPQLALLTATMQVLAKEQ